MSVVSEIFSGGAEGIFKGVRDVITTFKADPLEVLKLEQAINKAVLDAEVAFSQAQAKINEIEASSVDKFVARWRPAVGWTGVAGFGYVTIGYPLLTWASVNFGATPPPQIDPELLMFVLTGILGIGGMRSFEKAKGVTK